MKRLNYLVNGLAALAPVSYTHLDVYKRQVYIIAAILFTINGLLLVMLDVYNARDKQKNLSLIHI